MGNENVPNLYQIKIPSFDLSLHIAKVLAPTPRTSQNAAILTLLFCQIGEIDHLRSLEKWLWSKAENFLNELPRNQSNQIDKVLIAACCVYARIKTGKKLDTDLKKNLETYILYASKQNWFDDPFLAFYCYQIIEELPFCKSTILFFKSNFDHFIQRKNVSAIAQSLFVLNDECGELEVNQGFSVFNEKWKQSSITDLSWILIASSELKDPKISALSQKIVQSNSEFFSEYMGKFAKNSFTLDTLLLLGEDLSHMDIEEFVQSIQIPLEVKKVEGGIIISLSNKNLSDTKINGIFPILLFLLSFSLNEWHKIIGVFIADKEKLVSALKNEHMDKIKLKNITPLEMFITNILTIITTLIIGLTIIGYFLNVQMPLPELDFSQSDWRDIDIFLVGLGFIGLIFTQLIALITGNPAISHLVKISPIKQIVNFFKSTKKTS